MRLLGVNRSGAEYTCLGGRRIFDGPASSASVQAMVAWRVDAVRVPLNEDCWLGINGVFTGGRWHGLPAGDREIRGTLESTESSPSSISIWAAPGKYLARGQWRVPDLDHAPRFWSSVAKAFASNHGVIFDLFNEPYTTSWSCWRDGCATRYTPARKPVSYRSAGMQALVNAVRSTGAEPADHARRAQIFKRRQPIARLPAGRPRPPADSRFSYLQLRRVQHGSVLEFDDRTAGRKVACHHRRDPARHGCKPTYI